MSLTHACIPMGNGTYEILHKWEKNDKHVMDLNSLDYTSEDEFDEVSNTIEYNPWDLLLSLKFRLHMATRTPHHQHNNEVIHGTE